jgi:hypothetical protein
LEDKNDISNHEVEKICAIYFNTFNHREFTGRSGTFFKYEGLGSIYWHMVSKLLLAIQENYFMAIEQGTSHEIVAKLREYYYNVRAGLGVSKNPADYGAFPIDPYSHTPGFAGVQQPGMTGQVKEDFISRFGELGVWVNDGTITFKPVLLRKSEFIDGHSLQFTYCALPITYKIGDNESIEVNYSDGKKETIRGLFLNQQISADIFSRNGKIANIVVSFRADNLYD